MSYLPMHRLFRLSVTFPHTISYVEVELELRSILEAPTPDELPFEDEFLGYVDGQEVLI